MTMMIPQFDDKTMNNMMPYGFVSTGSLISDDDEDEPLDDGNTPLPEGYQPSKEDVVCARGRAYFNHSGNEYYRSLISELTPKYSESSNKLEKTLVVSEIVDKIQAKGGKFIKRPKRGGPFVIVSQVFAREKVGQSLRDGLSTKYKSATKFKKQKKAKSPEKVSLDVDKAVTSNRFVCSSIQELRTKVETCGDLASDAKIMTMFSRTNSDILEELKRDRTILQQFEATTSAAVADDIYRI